MEELVREKGDVRRGGEEKKKEFREGRRKGKSKQTELSLQLSVPSPL